MGQMKLLPPKRAFQGVVSTDAGVCTLRDPAYPWSNSPVTVLKPHAATSWPLSPASTQKQVLLNIRENALCVSERIAESSSGASVTTETVGPGIGDPVITTGMTTGDGVGRSVYGAGCGDEGLGVGKNVGVGVLGVVGPGVGGDVGLGVGGDEGLGVRGGTVALGVGGSDGLGDGAKVGLGVIGISVWVR